VLSKSGQATNNTVDVWTGPSEFINGYDHGVLASYLKLYEDKVEHINSPTFPFQKASDHYSKYQSGWFNCGFCHYLKDISYCEQILNWENWPNTIDMLDFTFFIQFQIAGNQSTVWAIYRCMNYIIVCVGLLIWSETTIHHHLYWYIMYGDISNLMRGSYTEAIATVVCNLSDVIHHALPSHLYQSK